MPSIDTRHKIVETEFVFIWSKEQETWKSSQSNTCASSNKAIIYIIWNNSDQNNIVHMKNGSTHWYNCLLDQFGVVDTVEGCE